MRQDEQQTTFWPQAEFAQVLARVQAAGFDDPVAYAIALEAAIEEMLQVSTFERELKA